MKELDMGNMNSWKRFIAETEDMVFYVLYHKYSYTSEDMNSHLFSVVCEDAYQTPSSETLTGLALKQKYNIDPQLWIEQE